MTMLEEACAKHLAHDSRSQHSDFHVVSCQ
jgi:hypothetical protein